MTSTTTDRVTLILDCLGHEDTDLCGQARLWRHRDGRYLTEEEAAMIEECTVGDIRSAMDLWHEDFVEVQEHSQLVHELSELLHPYAVSPGEPIRAIIARLPVAEMKRALKIWQQTSPSFEAWRRDQS